MKPWSYKRRKWNHDVEAHRHYLLDVAVKKVLATYLGRAIDNAILYGTDSVMYNRFGGGTWTCDVEVSDEIVNLITGGHYAKRSG